MMDNQSLVSIMMPAYNAELFIQSAIESIISQTYNNWELIIINDGSTDQTENIIKNFEDSRIQYYHQENKGEAAARNLALSKTKGEYVAFLDSDDKYLPDFLEKTVAFLSQNPEKDAVFTDGWFINTQDQVLEPLSSQRRGPFGDDLFEPLVRASDVFGPPICTLVRRNSIESNNIQFDSNIIIGPDWDFFTQLSAFIKWGYLNHKAVHYRVHESNITVTTGSEKRRASLAVCRNKAILNMRFNDCSIETKSYVFYDLLINLIYDHPELQNLALQNPKFTLLPKTEQARLIRLTVARSLAVKGKSDFLIKWINLSFKLNPADPKTWVIKFLIHLSPNLAQNILKRRDNSLQSINNSPFKIKL